MRNRGQRQTSDTVVAVALGWEVRWQNLDMEHSHLERTPLQAPPVPNPQRFASVVAAPVPRNKR